MSSAELVFTYGTLMRDHYNHSVVEDYVLDAQPGTVSGFKLLDLGAFPGAVPAASRGVRGEVFTVDNEDGHAMRRLDRLEGVPTLYTRERTTVALDDGSEVEAWIYVLAERRRYKLPEVEVTEGGADSWAKHAKRAAH